MQGLDYIPRMICAGMVEYLDIVDENDKVVGRCTREEAHSKGKRHRTVMFFVLSPDGKIMVTKRTDNKDFFPGYRSVVMGGHVSSGDTYEEALKREAREEIGTFGDYKEIGRFTKDIPEETENVKLYTIEVDPEDVRLSKDEFVEGRFIPLNDILKDVEKSDDFLPETKQVLEMFCQG